MNRLEITWSHTLSIWWSYIWRCSLFSIILGFILGGIAGLVLGFVGRGDLAARVGMVLGYLCAIIVSIIFLRKILNKRYKNFSIALIPNTD